MVQQAKDMALSLLENVKGNYMDFKENGPPNRGGGDRNQGYDNRGDRGGYHQRDRNGSGSYGGGGTDNHGGNNGQDQYGYGYGYSGQTPQTPTIVPFGTGAALQPQTAAALQAQGLNPGEIEQWSAYYAANAASDPFASMGGYGYYMAYFAATGQYLGAQPQQGDAGQQHGYGEYQSPPANGAQAPPPPPPPPDDVPPPPPPPPGAGNGFNAVSGFFEL